MSIGNDSYIRSNSFSMLEHFDGNNNSSVHVLKALLSIISSGPLVKLPTTTDFELAMIPEDKNGIPPLTVTGSTSTCNDSEMTLLSSSVVFGCIAAPVLVATTMDPV